MGTLDGKVAVITGAGQGVGEGVAFALAREGAKVAAVGRTEAKVIGTANAIRGFGGTAVPIECDVADPEQLSATIDTVMREFGTVDILVNNANFGILGPINEIERHRMEKALAVGPLATLSMMQLCYPLMKAQGGGSIINMVSSAAVRWDMSNFGAYAATKEAMRSLTRAAASEWGRDNIRVNAVAPHALSPGLKAWTESVPEEAAAFVKSIPMGRIGDCENDIGRAVVFLVGPDARYLTGATIPLDGGQARWS